MSVISSTSSVVLSSVDKADFRKFAVINPDGAVMYSFHCDFIQLEHGTVVVYDGNQDTKMILNLAPGFAVMEVADVDELPRVATPQP